MTSWNGNIFRVTGPLCGEFSGPDEFPTQRPVTQSFDVFFDLRLSKRLCKQPWGWWFETPSWSWWHHCNAPGGTFVNRQLLNHRQMAAINMMTSSRGYIFRVTVLLCSKLTGFIFSLICAWTKSWINNRNAGDLRRHRAHYDVTVMK